MRVRRTAAVLAAVLAHVMFFGIFTGTAQAAYPGRDGLIAFSNYYGIWTIRPDGSGLRQLTDDGDAPVWSPDGRRLAYTDFPEGGYQHDIYVMNADGSNQQRVTTASSSERSPTWSPDGTRLAFLSSPDSGGTSIYTLRSQAPYGRRTFVAEAPASSAPQWFDKLRWSPRGNAFAFTAETLNDWADVVSSRLMTVPAAGGTPRPIPTPGTVSPSDRSANYAPGGGRIVFATARPGGGSWGVSDIGVANADGTGRKILTANRCASWHDEPAWSPSGRRIAFLGLSSQCPDARGLVVMNADGTNQRLVYAPDSLADPRYIDWQPLPQ